MTRRRWLLAALGTILLGATRCEGETEPLPPVEPWPNPDSILTDPPVIEVE